MCGQSDVFVCIEGGLNRTSSLCNSVHQCWTLYCAGTSTRWQRNLNLCWDGTSRSSPHEQLYLDWMYNRCLHVGWPVYGFHHPVTGVAFCHHMNFSEPSLPCCNMQELFAHTLDWKNTYPTHRGPDMNDCSQLSKAAHLTGHKDDENKSFSLNLIFLISLPQLVLIQIDAGLWTVGGSRRTQREPTQTQGQQANFTETWPRIPPVPLCHHPQGVFVLLWLQMCHDSHRCMNVCGTGHMQWVL